MVIRYAPALIVLLACACAPDATTPGDEGRGSDADAADALTKKKKGDRGKDKDKDKDKHPGDDDDDDGDDDDDDDDDDASKVRVCHWSSGSDAWQLKSVSSESKHLSKHDCDVEAGSYFYDADADGYGDAARTSACPGDLDADDDSRSDRCDDACPDTASWVTTDGDCDDSDDAVNPGADESCNALDDDCDGDVDDAAVDATTWYADTDSDGYGDAGFSVEACDAPTDYVADGTDCDDGDGAVLPGATEQCDGVDNDCDGLTDDDDASVTGTSTFYLDGDGDGWGGTTAVAACVAPSAAYLTTSADCDDADAAVSPAATEACNGIDDDCDGLTDDDDSGVSGTSTWYADADGDGHGDGSAPTSACVQPAATSASNGDCDDGDAAVSPTGTEACNGVDDDCDGDVDSDAGDATTWFADLDLDGYGDASTSAASCDAPSGYVDDSSDCDDSDDGTNPGASEACDEVDNDCNGEVDEIASCDIFTVGNASALALNGTFGANTLLGTTIKVPDAMTVTALGLVSRGGGGVQIGLYTDTGAGPGTLVVTTGTTSAAPGANEFAVSEVAIAAGSYYLMGVWFRNTPNYYAASPAKKTYYVAHTYGTALPTTYKGGSTYTNQDYNYYLVGY